MKPLITVTVLLAAVVLLAGLAGCGGGGGGPRSQVILFASDRDGDMEIFVMDEDGGNQTQLTFYHNSDETSPVWSPDGTKIAFVSDMDGDEEIYIMNADGSDVIPLTTNTYPDSDPSWSPDGLQIVFVREIINQEYEIIRVNADKTGGEDILLTDDYSLTYPRWSSDGLIAFDWYVDGHYHIYTMDTDGENLTPLTTGDQNENTPAWSPDGDRLAYAFRPGAGSYEINTMTSSGTDIRMLTSGEYDFYPWYSSDGARIVFRSNQSGNQDIWIMDADGSGRTNLTNHPANEYMPCIK